MNTQQINFVKTNAFKTPVLFLIFNRPETTQQVFSAIRKAKPLHLYVAADGPRPGFVDEAKHCELAREVATNVDWDCEVKTLFRENNLGCRFAVSEAIDWFFEQELEGIILEDDCLPDQSFFFFCQKVLEHFRHDTRIMHVGGTNFQFGNNQTKYSYYFSRYVHVWGWASWRRAWTFYDEKMTQLPVDKYNEILIHWREDGQNFIRYWNNVFQQTARGEIDTWDHQWTFACWNQNGLSVVPSVNLISNLGFSKESTHTKKTSPLANMSTDRIELPLIHPQLILRHQKADRYVERQQFSRPILYRLLQKFFRSIYLRKNDKS